MMAHIGSSGGNMVDKKDTEQYMTLDEILDAVVEESMMTVPQAKELIIKWAERTYKNV